MLVKMELRQIIRAGQGAAVIVLGEVEGKNREFPVIIDHLQAQALEMAVNKTSAPRPLTHDLVLNVITGMGGKLTRIIVDKLQVEKYPNGAESGVFHGKLAIDREGADPVLIDTRPSDAVVLASKESVPIFVDEEVLEQVDAKPPPDSPPDEPDDI